MKKLFGCICCVLFLSANAGDLSIEKGRDLLGQCEYQQALEVFDGILKSTPIFSSAEQQSDYLTAALHAMVTCLKMQDFENAKHYNKVMQFAIDTWYGLSVEAQSQNDALANLKSSVYGVWMCTNCKNVTTYKPMQCRACKEEAFYFSGASD